MDGRSTRVDYANRICDLKYFAGKANELQLLRDRVAELEELLGLAIDPCAALMARGLTRAEAVFCIVILKRQGIVSREHIFTAMYGSTAECDQPDIKILDVFAFKVRQKFKAFTPAIFLSTARACGFFFDQENKVRLRALIEAPL